MAYCRNCGAQIEDQTVICPNCGAMQQTQQPNNMYGQPNNMSGQPNNMYGQPNNMYGQRPSVKDSGNFGWAILGFFFPLVGLILFLAWRKTKPLCAKKAGMGALVAVVIGLIGSVMSFFFGYNSYYYY